MPAKATGLPKTDQGWQGLDQNQRPPAERRWIGMGGGLAVCLETNGGKVFLCRYRRIGDKNASRVTIGYFPRSVSVAEARQRVAEIRSSAKEGADPALARRRAREGIEEVATFGQLAERYLARRAESGGLRDKTLGIETQALAPLRRALGDRLLADLEARDFSAVIEREAKRLRKAGRTGRLANLSLAAAKSVSRTRAARASSPGRRRWRN